jgi:hypothetical protein
VVLKIMTAAAIAAIYAASVPPPLANGAALAKTTRTAMRMVLAGQNCESDLDGDRAGPLSASEAIVFLVCDLGAYQRGVLAFRVPRANPDGAKLLKTARLPGLEKGSWGESGMFIEPEYDPKRAELTTFVKDRADAACGLSATWVYDGAAFRLAEFQRGEDCDPDVGWRLVYKAKVVLPK